MQSGTSLSCNVPARKAGYYSIKAVVDGVTSNDIYVQVMYPDVSAIKSNGTVASEMLSVWEATKAAASPSGRKEMGFWIFANTTGNSLSYECGQIINGPNTSCGNTASISFSNPGDQASSNPLVGGKYYVAFFHTHTPLTYCFHSDPTRTYFREVGPSGPDNNIDYPGLLYDYLPILNGGVYQGHNIKALAQVYTFALDRRQTPI